MEWRPMRRKNQQVTEEECAKVLKEVRRGVLAMNGVSEDNGYPYAVPINFFFDETGKKIYFHCAKVGKKMDLINADSRVAFVVYNQGFQKEGDWVYNPTSVMVFGKLKKVKDSAEVEDICRRLGNKYYPHPEDVEMEIHKAVKRVQIFELTPEYMTGKLVNES